MKRQMGMNSLQHSNPLNTKLHYCCRVIDSGVPLKLCSSSLNTVPAFVSFQQHSFIMCSELCILMKLNTNGLSPTFLDILLMLYVRRSVGHRRLTGSDNADVGCLLQDFLVIWAPVVRDLIHWIIIDLVNPVAKSPTIRLEDQSSPLAIHLYMALWGSLALMETKICCTTAELTVIGTRILCFTVMRAHPLHSSFVVYSFRFRI